MALSVTLFENAPDGLGPERRLALQSTDGMWLHGSITRHKDGTPRMTDVVAWRWSGTESQLAAVLRQNPDFASLRRVRLMRPMSANNKI